MSQCGNRNNGATTSARLKYIAPNSLAAVKGSIRWIVRVIRISLWCRPQRSTASDLLAMVASAPRVCKAIAGAKSIAASRPSLCTNATPPDDETERLRGDDRVGPGLRACQTPANEDFVW